MVKNFILVGFGIITGLDKKFQAYILDAGFFDVTKIEFKFSRLSKTAWAFHGNLYALSITLEFSISYRQARTLL